MEDLVQQILAPNLPVQESNADEINRIFFQKLETTTSLEEFNEQLLKTSTKGTLERISMISKYFEWVPIPPETISKYSKHPGLSSQLREKANEFFRTKNYQSALQCYTLAIMYSPWNSETLGLAFANRSATLLAMGKALEALQDIDSAYAHNYPEKFRKKLDERRQKCDDILRKTQQSGDETESQSMIERDKRKKFCQGILFRVKKPNALMTSAEEFVQIQFHPTHGRQLIVNRDIPAGTILIVEKPFISVLKDLLKWDVTHCHFCLRKIIQGLPCQGCVFAIYCNESCRGKAAEEFHGFECPCMPYLHCNATPRYILLALRIISKLGPNKLQELFQENLNSLSSPLDRYDSDSYNPIYHLVTHSNPQDPIDVYTKALNALIVATTLQTQSNFFEGIPQDKKQDFFNFTASMILHHIDNIPFNSISLDEVEGLEKYTLSSTLHGIDREELSNLIRSIQFPQFAAGVYTVASLMNHSCDPNVTRVVGLTDGTLAIVATRSLKCNEEIVTCYSRSFTSDTIDIRRAYLSENYCFDCDCIACRNNWPELSVLMKSRAVSCCRSCAGIFPHDQKESKEFQRCVIQGSGCKHCGSQYSLHEIEDELNRNIELFFQAYRLVLANAPLEAIRTLMPVLKFFQTCVRPPYSKAYMGQDVYKQALELVVYFSR
ncbi:unnamed protein product [Allacma fusca]|uniref:Protein-lysine N-methyltransferase SMYD4 n=1 Tax=Allacma fusca TaxID=39272 RepID=A0A8J2KUP1_9HEXA|nr:unnamed protein product [Allacma fusca]